MEERLPQPPSWDVEEKQKYRLARRWSGERDPRRGLERATCRGIMASGSHGFGVRGLSFACRSSAAVSKELSLVTCELDQQQCPPQVL